MRHRFAVQNWLRASFLLRPGRRPPRGADRAGGPRAPLDRRGRGDGDERRDPHRRRLRHHGAARGRDRLVRRRRRDPPLDLGVARADRPRRRARPRGHPRRRDPAAPGASARAARGGRQAHRARRRHGGRTARAPRDRRRAGLPRPLPQTLAVGAGRRCPDRDPAVDARRRPGAPAGDLRRGRHVDLGAVRPLGHDRRRRPGRVLRLRRVPRDPAPHGRGGRRQGDALPRRRPADARRARGRAGRERAGRAGARSLRRAPCSPTCDRASRSRPGSRRASSPPPRRSRPRSRRGSAGSRPTAASGSATGRSRSSRSPPCGGGSSSASRSRSSSPGSFAASSTRGGGHRRTRRSSTPSGSRTRSTCSTRCRTASTRRSTSAAARSRGASGSGSCWRGRSSPTPRSSCSSSRRARSTPTPRRASRATCGAPASGGRR